MDEPPHNSSDSYANSSRARRSSRAGARTEINTAKDLIRLHARRVNPHNSVPILTELSTDRSNSRIGIRLAGYAEQRDVAAELRHGADIAHRLRWRRIDDPSKATEEVAIEIIETLPSRKCQRPALSAARWPKCRPRDWR